MPNVTVTRAVAQQTQGELRHQVDAATVHDAIAPGQNGAAPEVIPGEVLAAAGELILNADRPTASVRVHNTGDRPIQVGSHFHFFEVNKMLEFDRELAFGMRLDIPSGTAARFEPGQEKEVALVEIAGARNVTGFNNLTNGSIRSEKVKQQALERARQQGFRGA